MTATINIPTEDLPHWMRQAQRGWDWGFVLALAFALVAAWPFLLQPGLPRTNASESYVFMTADYSDALVEGRLYPRWSPHVFGGYGAPIPHYYPPAAAYSAALVKILFTNDPVDAVRVIYVLAFCIASASVYLLVKRRVDATAGLFTAALYLFSPYFAHVAPHIQGDLPLVLALALTPTLFWSVDRLLSINRPADMLLVSLITAALLLTHVYTAIAALLLALCFTGCRLLSGGRSLQLPLIAMFTGVLLSAFYWFPALLENDLVNWHSSAAARAPQISLRGLLLPLQPVDLQELSPQPQYTLGLTILCFVIVALGGLLLTRYKAGFPLFFLVTGVFCAALAVMYFPAQTWLTGIITLCLAIGAGGAVTLRQRLPQRWQRLYFAALLLVILGLSRPVWLAPKWPESFGEVTPAQQIAYEQQGTGIAVLPPNAPLPATIAPTLPTNRLLVSGYLSGIINKIAPPPVSAGTHISLINHQTHTDTFQVRLDVPARLSILTAHFAGWRAYSAARDINLLRDSTTGLMTLEAPALNGELIITLGTTPIRQTAWLISGSTLLTLLALTWMRSRRRSALPDETDLLTVPESRLVSISLGCFVGLILLVAAPSAPYALHPRPGHALDNAIALRNVTQTGFTALAYRLNRAYFQPGDTVDLTLYWETSLPLTNNYRVQVHLRRISDGTRWHRTAFHIPGDYPTSRWRRYFYVRDDHLIRLSDNIVSGDYEVIIEAFNCDIVCRPQDRLTFFDNNGHAIGQSMALPVHIRIVP